MHSVCFPSASCLKLFRLTSRLRNAGKRSKAQEMSLADQAVTLTDPLTGKHRGLADADAAVDVTTLKDTIEDNNIDNISNVQH